VHGAQSLFLTVALTRDTAISVAPEHRRSTALAPFDMQSDQTVVDPLHCPVCSDSYRFFVGIRTGQTGLP
jgi:hypothetical protein